MRFCQLIITVFFTDWFVNRELFRIKDQSSYCHLFCFLTLTENAPLERVVDLCAAPGSWSQVLSKRLWESKSPKDQKSVLHTF